jgi:hypothetical protein
MDRYIDNEETQKYGPQFSASFRRLFGTHESEPVRGFALWCGATLDAATNTMDAAMKARRENLSEQGAVADDKLPAVTSARADLRAFHLHLGAKKADTDEPWDGDMELFVPGGMSNVRRGARSVRDAVKNAHEALTKDARVPDRAKWLARLDRHVTELSPLIERADEAAHAKNGALSEQSDEKRNWLRTYRALALILEGLLMLFRREDEYKAAVPHLTAPGNRKKTDGAPNAPAAPATPAQPA